MRSTHKGGNLRFPNLRCRKERGWISVYSIDETSQERVVEMADSLKIDPDCIVADVLSTWPRTIPVFYKNNMGCVGCVMAKFETLVDVAEIYGLEIEYLIDALQDAILAAEMGKGEG